METKVYTAPTTEVVNIKMEGVICQSVSANRADYGDPITDTWVIGL